MISIKDKKDCSGCSACQSVCPKSCITLCADEQGFSYPRVNAENCIECGLCLKVCPVINKGEARRARSVLAAINPDIDIRLKSSSGGVFSMLAQHVLAHEGVVFGAKFSENWMVEHGACLNEQELGALRGSKYVQSDLGSTFKQVKEFLQQGKQVLFTGAPCQCAGLKRFLGCHYDNLLLVDFVCHGVPSPLVWQNYLAEKFKIEDIKSITFRDKSLGWERYSMKIEHGDSCFTQPFYQNDYLRGFLRGLYLRPSCYSCASKGGRSGSDITIADFWGIDAVAAKLNDHKGVGLVLLYSDKGERVFSHLGLDALSCTYAQAFKCNPSLEKSTKLPKAKRKYFFEYYEAMGVSALSAYLTRPTRWKKFTRGVRKFLKI